METVNTNQKYIVILNAGSSSIKLAVFIMHTDGINKTSEVTIENIGQASASLVTDDGSRPVTARDHMDANGIIVDWLTGQLESTAIIAVSHRIVHGGPKYYETQIATDEVIADLRSFADFDPEHLPIELQLVESFQKLLPDATHILCFDTAFHHDLPSPARLLPVPRRLAADGVRRYGFHGLSYAFILEELRRVEGRAAANGKVIIAHLGSGASLTALQNGQSIDTTMSMTPASGIPMSTRSGDLDPGLMFYLTHTQGYDADQLHHMVNFESGLLGISETTADMKKLLEIEAEDDRARDAVDMFCYQIKKTIGGLTAALGGLHTLIFTGGMGENAPKIRSRICEDLSFLGITLDSSRNEAGARLISADGSQVGVHVIHTDEAVTIARETATLLKS